VHKEEVNIAGVVDKEGLMTGGHEESCLLVGTIANLRITVVSILHSNRRIGRVRVVRVENLWYIL
jgi:hypothetical protein